MYEMWSDYSLTNIANQVMNLLPFALTQHTAPAKYKNSGYNGVHSLTRYISALLSFHYKGEIFLP